MVAERSQADPLSMIKTALAQSPAPQLPVATRVAQDLELLTPDQIKSAAESGSVNPGDQQQAQRFVDQLLASINGTTDGQKAAKDAVAQFGGNVGNRLAESSKMLNQPMRRLMDLGDDGGKIAGRLADLKVNFDAVNPRKFNFEPGWFGRAFSFLPLVGKPVNKFFVRYESAGNVISSLFVALETDKKELLRDNDILRDDQAAMRELTIKLQRIIAMGYLIDKQLEAEALRFPEGSEQRKLVQEELLFSLRQRLLDLQQQLVVAQQGIMSYEIIIRNNLELVRGIERCRNVTEPALRVGVTVALALAKQKIIIGKIEDLNRVTEDFITYNAAALRTQGAAIQKQASSSMLNMDVLQRAMDEAVGAFNDISAFRQNALGQMKENIDRHRQMVDKGFKTIERMEKANKAKPVITLDIDSAPGRPALAA
jgi:uncharacterized protein YaaN involved in tellurite resistance